MIHDILIDLPENIQQYGSSLQQFTTESGYIGVICKVSPDYTLLMLRFGVDSFCAAAEIDHHYIFGGYDKPSITIKAIQPSKQPIAISHREITPTERESGISLPILIGAVAESLRSIQLG